MLERERIGGRIHDTPRHIFEVTLRYDAAASPLMLARDILPYATYAAALALQHAR